MSLIALPEIKSDFKLSAAQFDLRPDAVDRWLPDVKSATDSTATISILDTIGENMEGGGITAKRIAAILRNVEGSDIVVDINSPGGNFFEGVAIYNQLREHKGKVTCRVLSLAASAASVIAMAGDEILMGDGAFLMIHNSWAVAVGNRHDLAEASALMAPFDDAMASLYASRTGLDKKFVCEMMDKETWLSVDQAMEDGFATGKISVESGRGEDAERKKPLAMIEAAMAKAGYSRNARRGALKSLFERGTPSAAESAKPCAGSEATALIKSLLHSMTN